MTSENVLCGGLPNEAVAEKVDAHCIRSISGAASKLTNAMRGDNS